MKKIKGLLIGVGLVQLVLGLLYLVLPDELLRWMGHSIIAKDISYPLGMLASRFIVYGALLLLAARSPMENRTLILGMIWIQALDLAVGMYYTLQGTVEISLSGFPIFNALLLASFLWLWLPAQHPDDKQITQ